MSSASMTIGPDEVFIGERVSLRLITLADCTEEYVSWLRNPEVNRYLETRWTEQNMNSVHAFVATISEDPSSFLFAIIENESGRHIGNLKIGPMNAHHGYADISYFIGDRECWGKGYAPEAIMIASNIAFRRLGVRRLQAGLYEGNRQSARALEKAGFHYECRFERQLAGPDGREDHVWYALFAENNDD